MDTSGDIDSVGVLLFCFVFDSIAFEICTCSIQSNFWSCTVCWQFASPLSQRKVYIKQFQFKSDSQYHCHKSIPTIVLLPCDPGSSST